MDKQNYWFSVYKHRKFLRPYVFKTVKQTEKEMLELVKFLLSSHKVSQVEVRATKTEYWKEFTLEGVPRY